ncbi:MFS transporter [Ohtaekwangia koreensis]|uniref:Predicted arabinose efflux permease, MFS family n=1 Tax=Ohtaekwangia koreensis TaxID=688867 RepID=A0A1T5LZJ8_9BACT|nr:MFS transporter [Ohtaekwangia koreensis]SKC81392.1 Predicted arabinose efflux permease, MFS family [Ohtaekwangia koreensis]
MRANVLKAFQSWNYRLYFSGQSISLIGTWMQRTAVYWLIYEKTQSSFMLGVAVFAAQFPSFLFSILGGVIADRYNRYKVLLFTQLASLIQAALLTTLVLLDNYMVWQILALSVLLGIINAFDVPARQAMVYDMVDNKEHLPNAIALNSSMVHTARLIGPAVSGLVLQQYGAAICFLVNALSFIAVITSLLCMKLPPYKKREHVNNAFIDLKEGFGYLKNTPAISTIMLMLACISLLALPYITLLPVYAKEIFLGEASTFGYLNSFVGLGAVCGAFFLASLKSGTNLKKVLFFNTLIFGLGLIIFSHLTHLPIALLAIAFTGFGMMSQTTISNTLIQTTVAPAMRGRVISYYAMAFFGMQPIGGLLVGTLSHYLGAPNTILIEGLATLLIALIFFPFLRRDLLKRKHKIKIDQLEERSIETT